MNKNILAVYILVLLCLLSCDINALNELLSRARDKSLEVENTNVEALKVRKENKDFVEKQLDDINLFEAPVRVQKDMQEVFFNTEIPMYFQQGYPYYPQQKEVRIEKEDLVVITREEKEAQTEIDKVKSVLKEFQFGQLIENARELKDEYKDLESSFYHTFLELKAKIELLKMDHSREGKMKYRNEIQKLVQLHNDLNEQRSNLDMIMNQVDSGLSELGSAKGLFENAQKTLKEALIERLKNKSRSYSFPRRDKGGLLAKSAQSYAESALNQLESASSKLAGARGEKKDIEELVKDVRSFL
ncbi:P12 family lipoprotein (plasmid) [Borrelia coriaceae]|uniref:BBH37-like helical domain-containing protein n=1 Tax=Borrelia coriaceae ATCC 43381 TaxID=1408429 RepID=W5SXU2_9SPIR|nr:P12 family lipoprotein [Borrelia coriaceae]AHH11702.1 Hypothetical protein BCO_0015702 [Borrelia coriaceae ATCC 43381]UPA17336.1 P12 family lipoprotein [Borrelia coriaceae]